MAEQSAPAVVIPWHFEAAPSAVWRAWTDADLVRRWWGSDPEGEVTSASLDVRPGGRFAVSFRDSTGDEHTSAGEYVRVVPLTELEFTWSWADESNDPSVVTVEFAPDGSGTAMRFTHAELRGVSQHDYADGWRRTFAKLDRVLA